MRWVELRLLKQNQHHEPHEQVLPNGRTIQITERPTPEGGLVITYHDVTALRRASAEIESLAFYDPLTNLPNRRLLLDLTHSRPRNAPGGQGGGDMRRRGGAEPLKPGVRGGAPGARLGGDEF